jgi:hypothetical protein
MRTVNGIYAYAASLIVGLALLLLHAGEASADQMVSRGMERIFAPGNASLDIDGRDDLRVDVDVAILDSGIDLDHPDLNVVGRTNCVGAVAPTYVCVSGSPTDGDDSHGHGTAAAGKIGAIDNDIGAIGVAPGARLWAVDVLGDDVFTHSPPIANMNALIAGVKWVTATRTDNDPANDIEVATHIPCSPLEPPVPMASCPSDDEGHALEDAISDSIDKGVVFIVAGGNENSEINMAVPMDDPLLIGGSAMSDFDGLPGSLTEVPTCEGVEYPEQTEGDDTLSDNTRQSGPGVDIAAPGYCIGGVGLGGTYPGGPGSAVSSAAPHIAGAAALLASKAASNSRTGVETIRDDLIAAGNQDWTDDSGDAVQEPLLDVSDESLFDPVMVAGTESEEIAGIDALSLSAGTIDVYARGIDDTLRHKRFAAGQWSEWDNAGGTITSDPAAVSRSAGLVDLFARNGTGAVGHSWWHASTGWSAWGSHGGSTPSSPSPVSRSPGMIDLYGRGPNDILYHKWYTDSAGWSSPWASMGAAITSAPATISRNAGDIDLVGRGAAGQLMHMSYTPSTGWSTWTSLGAPIASGPAVTSTQADELDVFARAADDAVWHKSWSVGGGWTAAQSLGGQWTGDPAVVSTGSGNLTVLAVDPDDNLWQNSHDGSGWTGWEIAQ